MLTWKVSRYCCLSFSCRILFCHRVLAYWPPFAFARRKSHSHQTRDVNPMSSTLQPQMATSCVNLASNSSSDSGSGSIIIYSFFWIPSRCRSYHFLQGIQKSSTISRFCLSTSKEFAVRDLFFFFYPPYASRPRIPVHTHPRPDQAYHRVNSMGTLNLSSLHLSLSSLSTTNRHNTRLVVDENDFKW